MTGEDWVSFGRVTVPMQRFQRVIVRTEPDPHRDAVRDILEATFPAGPERTWTETIPGPAVPVSWVEHLRHDLTGRWRAGRRWCGRRWGLRWVDRAGRALGKRWPVRYRQRLTTFQVTARVVFPDAAQTPGDQRYVQFYVPSRFPTMLGDPVPYVQSETVRFEDIATVDVAFGDPVYYRVK